MNNSKDDDDDSFHDWRLSKFADNDYAMEYIEARREGDFEGSQLEDDIYLTTDHDLEAWMEEKEEFEAQKRAKAEAKKWINEDGNRSCAEDLAATLTPAQFAKSIVSFRRKKDNERQAYKEKKKEYLKSNDAYTFLVGMKNYHRFFGLEMKKPSGMNTPAGVITVPTKKKRKLDEELETSDEDDDDDEDNDNNDKKQKTSETSEQKMVAK